MKQGQKIWNGKTVYVHRNTSGFYRIYTVKKEMHHSDCMRVLFDFLTLLSQYLCMLYAYLYFFFLSVLFLHLLMEQKSVKLNFTLLKIQKHYTSIVTSLKSTNIKPQKSVLLHTAARNWTRRTTEYFLLPLSSRHREVHISPPKSRVLLASVSYVYRKQSEYK